MQTVQVRPFGVTHNLVDVQWHWDILGHQQRVRYDSVSPAGDSSHKQKNSRGPRIVPCGTPDGTGERLKVKQWTKYCWPRTTADLLSNHCRSFPLTPNRRVSEAAFGGRHCQKPLRDPNTQCPTAGPYLETGQSRDKTPAARWLLIDPEGNHAVHSKTKDRETPSLPCRRS